jgi:hypothetical protein
MLDLVGRDTVAGWGLAFGHLAIITLVGLALVRHFNRVPAPLISAAAALPVTLEQEELRHELPRLPETGKPVPAVGSSAG